MSALSAYVGSTISTYTQTPTYTTAGSITPPAYTKRIEALLVGGGGGGAVGGGGGFGGCQIYEIPYLGRTLSYTIGAGGAAGNSGGTTIVSDSTDVVWAMVGGGGAGGNGPGGTLGPKYGGSGGGSAGTNGWSGAPPYNAARLVWSFHDSEGVYNSFGILNVASLLTLPGGTSYQVYPSPIAGGGYVNSPCFIAPGNPALGYGGAGAVPYSNGHATGGGGGATGSAVNTNPGYGGGGAYVTGSAGVSGGAIGAHKSWIAASGYIAGTGTTNAGGGGAGMLGAGGNAASGVGGTGGNGGGGGGAGSGTPGAGGNGCVVFRFYY